ncbi:extracellular solute-binding protein [Paenibacillus vulneris]|uniref:Extracellular solute-binding protein n=1 Tax=Paenibacillus vulneris TaxID=1133364 RepID=A0ABW3UTD9_9BACL
MHLSGEKAYWRVTKRKKQKKGSQSRIAGTMAALLLSSALLAACGGGKAAGKTEGAAQDSGPLELSIMTVTPSTPPASDDNVIKREIEKATNSKMSIRWVSNNIYTEKLNIALASGDIPDLTMINDPFNSTFRTMVAQGAFWDITPYIKDYPNLQNGTPKIAWELTKMEDGKNYGIPRARDENDEAFLIVRKDWLDKLNLKPPTTTEELYAMMKAFAEQDPDGNGKNDTFGLSTGFDTLLGTFEGIFTGVNGKWKLEGDKLVYTAFLPEVRKALEFTTQAYKEKLLPEDQLSLKLTQVRDLYKGNRAGSVIDKTGTGNRVYATDLRKLVPTFKDTDFYPLTSINGFTPKGTGFNGILAIPKTVPEAKMKRILKLIDTWMTNEVGAIQRFGLEGVHHNVVNGVKVTIPEKLNADNASDFNQIVNPTDPSLDAAAPTPDMKAADDQKRRIQEERAKISVPDISVGLSSPTALMVLPDLEKQILDLKSKIVIGREPISAWDDFVAKTKNSPDVIKMTEEMTQAYHKRIGK